MDKSLRLAAVFGDHMVLQRGKEIAVFGFGADGRTVRAELNQRRGQATVKDGRFLLHIPPMEAGGAYTLRVTDGESELTFSDVYVGDVFLAGGQSNMELELQNAKDGHAFCESADNPLIRFYNTPKVPVMSEVEAAEKDTKWRVLAPCACADVSAVMFHFAVELQAKLGIAIGVIDCYWGGTSASCWINRDALSRFTVGQSYLSRFEDAIADQDEEQYERACREYDERNIAWWDKATGMKRDNPDISYEELAAVLGDSPWPPPLGPKTFFRPAGLADTMLKRVAPYTVKAFTYYQGETDTEFARDYFELMTALIFYWRALWGDNSLPFIMCQLPMFIDKNDIDDKNWAILRKAQADVAASVNNTGLTVLIDCGERHNIHPVDKLTVGHRLFLCAMRLVYGDMSYAESPCAVSKRQEDGALIVKLSAPASSRGEAALFELAGEDGEFFAARAEISGDTLRLASPSVPYPVQARYAWVGYGEVNVFGQDGLPLAPFWLK